MFNFIELEEFFEEQKERNLIENTLFISLAIEFNNNLFNNNNILIENILNSMRIPIKVK